MHHKTTYAMLTAAIMTWMAMPAWAAGETTLRDIDVETNRAQEEAKYDSQQVQIITAKEIEEKQAKSVEDIIFTQTGVSKTVDAMGRTGVSIRGAEPRHTLILIDGQPVRFGQIFRCYG